LIQCCDIIAFTGNDINPFCAASWAYNYNLFRSLPLFEPSFKQVNGYVLFLVATFVHSWYYKFSFSSWR